MQIKTSADALIKVEIALSEHDGIFWLDARCELCGSECVRAHKTGYGFILQCLDCKQEETLQTEEEIAVRDWRI